MTRIVVTNRQTRDVREFRFEKNEILIGRASDCDIALATDGVSRRHARLVLTNQLAAVEDLGSGNGTFLGGETIPPKQMIPLKKGDQIRIEEFTIEVEIKAMTNVPIQKQPDAPEETEALTGKSLSGKFDITDPDILEIKMIKKILGAFDTDKRPGLYVVTPPFDNLKAYIEDDEADFVVGRDPANPLCIDSQTVSRRHAKIAKKWGSYVISDLGSKNGTFVNGETIQEKIIKDGDEIVFGTIKVLFKNPEEFDIETISRSMADEQKAHDKIREAAELEKAEQAKLAAAKAAEAPAKTGPSDQAKLSLVPDDKAGAEKAKSVDSKTNPNIQVDTKETAKADEKGKTEEKAKAKPDKAKKDAKAAPTAEDKKKDEKSAKTPAQKSAPGLFRQFSALEYSLFGFGVLLIVLIAIVLFYVLR